jgi:phenylalanyl-tRNA synthetase beta chain
MKVSLNWLEDFVSLPKSKPEVLAQEITEHSFEVEKVIPVSKTAYEFSNVFTAKVLEVQKHPNADRLRVVRLDLGNRIIEPVVCGANNFEAEDIVALALPGARIAQNIHSDTHESFVLGSAKIRGIESQGMICSGFELGLRKVPESKPEILLFPKNTPVGTELVEYLKAKEKPIDYVFDLSLPANRPDLYSHMGIARELASILQFKLKGYGAKLESLTLPKTKDKFSVRIDNKELCPYYVGVKLKVKVGPSPDFIQARLKALGFRPINNVVDITNYVMYELGEPLHAFDASKIVSGIVVRNAKKGEKITTIDHKQRTLEPEMLVIADQTRALAVAGVMGGVDSEVNEQTEEIILEAANFEPIGIRKTSKKLALRTDGSTFWEKGLDPKQAQMGAARAIELLEEYAQAEVLSVAEVGKKESKERLIKFDTEQINNILGSRLQAKEIAKLLSHLSMNLVQKGDAFTATIPYYRKDMENYADFADEILKMNGLNKLERLPLVIQRTRLQHNEDQSIMKLKEQLAMLGFEETQNYSFISNKDLTASRHAENEHVRVANPLSADQELLRKDLLIPILKTAARNARFFSTFRLFEVGKGYHGFLKEDDLVAYLMYDRNKQINSLIAEAKGYLERLLSTYSKNHVVYEQNNRGTLSLHLNNVELGELIVVTPGLLANFELEGQVVFVSLNLERLFKSSKENKYASFSRYPAKVLDISAVFNEDTTWDKIEAIIRSSGGSLVRSVEVFEAGYLYMSGSIPEFHKKLAEKGLKNLAFHVIYQSDKETLKDSEIMPIHAKIVEELKVKLNAEIR